jgi:hypothetical protein
VSQQFFLNGHIGSGVVKNRGESVSERVPPNLPDSGPDGGLDMVS